MIRGMTIAVCLLTAALSWAQSPPPPPGESLKAQGFTDSQAKAIQADLDQWDQLGQTVQADIQVLNAQEKRYLLNTTINRADVEKIIRSRADSMVKRDLARLDLMIKWKDAYGADKVKLLEPRLRPQARPSDSPPAGPQGPDNGPAPGPTDGPAQP